MVLEQYYCYIFVDAQSGRLISIISQYLACFVIGVIITAHKQNSRFWFGYYELLISTCEGVHMVCFHYCG